jgi:WD40 repeat protein
MSCSGLYGKDPTGMRNGATDRKRQTQGVRMRSMNFLIAAVMLAATAGQAQATMLLTSGAETQIETWLGQGNLSFNELFSKVPGATSFDWHAAVDGLGPTVTLLEVINVLDPLTQQPLVIGYYNPNSWSSSGDFYYTHNLSDRTAFLFNLNTDLKLDQRLDARGQFQSYNALDYGPTAGGGFDLYVDTYLINGASNNYSFGPTISSNTVIGVPYYSAYTFGRLETYSFSPAAITTPEPASMALAGFAGVGMAIGTWRRRRQQPSAKLSQTAA